MTDINLPKAVAVIGAGTMGNGIAQVFAHSGVDTHLIDVDHVRFCVGNAKQAAVFYASTFGFRITQLHDLTECYHLSVSTAHHKAQVISPNLGVELGRELAPNALKRLIEIIPV